MGLKPNHILFRTTLVVGLFLAPYGLNSEIPFHPSIQTAGAPRLLAKQNIRLLDWTDHQSGKWSFQSNASERLLLDFPYKDEATVKNNDENSWLLMFFTMMWTKLILITRIFDIKLPKFVPLSSAEGRSWQGIFATALIMWLFSYFNLHQIISDNISRSAAWYMVLITSFPLYTKCLTAAFIGFTGDTAAQIYEERIRIQEEGDIWPSSFREMIGKYNIRRGLSCLFDDICISGPFLHFAYNFLEDMIPVDSASGSSSLAALAHVLIDDLVLDAIFVAITFIVTGIGEGYIHEIIPQFKNDFIPTVKTTLVANFFILPFEFICFRFVPLSFRVLGMNLIDIFWCALISFLAHRNRHKTCQKRES